jgi:hypothetical protein
MNSIVFSGDDEEKSWCDQKNCGGLLIPFKGESMITTKGKSEVECNKK